MIINLSNFGGGGGGGYVLPIASSQVLGGVMIGDGININSAGTISVSAQTPETLQVTSYENISNNEFGLALTLEELGIWTTDNSGYTIDLSYVSEDFIGNIGNGSSIINGYQNGVSFGVEITADGLKTSCVDTDDWILLYELTGLTYGTYTAGSGEIYEAVIEYTPDNKFSVHFTNGLAYAPNLAFAGLFTPVWKQENVFYKIKQRQPIASTGNTGMVKIGSGINVDSVGTISVPTVDPSTIKSVSALPQTAVAGDVVSYSNQFWEYKSTSGTSCVITNMKGNNEYGDIVINYYSLPENQVLLHFTTNFGFERYASYNNGVFTLWEDSGMTTSAETITEGSSVSLWWDNVVGYSIPGVLSLTSLSNPGGNINLSISIVGNWNIVSSGHWEPSEWSQQLESNSFYKNNLIPSTTIASVSLIEGIKPKAIVQTEWETIPSGTIGNKPFRSIAVTDNNTGCTINLEYLPYTYTGDVFNYWTNSYVIFVSQDAVNTLRYVVAPSDMSQQYASGTTSGDGTYSFGSGEQWEGSLVVSGNTINAHFTNEVSDSLNAIEFPVVGSMHGDRFYPVPFRH